MNASGASRPRHPARGRSARSFSSGVSAKRKGRHDGLPKLAFLDVSLALASLQTANSSRAARVASDALESTAADERALSSSPKRAWLVRGSLGRTARNPLERATKSCSRRQVPTAKRAWYDELHYDTAREMRESRIKGRERVRSLLEEALLEERLHDLAAADGVHTASWARKRARIRTVRERRERATRGRT